MEFLDMLEIDNARVVLQNSLSKKENSKPMFIKIIATKYFSTDASIDDCTLAKTIFRYFKYNFDDIFLILNNNILYNIKVSKVWFLIVFG